MRDFLTDKKLIIDSLLSLALLFLIFIIAGYLGVPFYNAKNEPCFIMVPEEYCRSGVMIEYLGQSAVGFNLPEGTEIYTPYDAAFLEDGILYEDEEDTIEAESFVRARFVDDKSSTVVFVAYHSPVLRSLDTAKVGTTAATILVSDEPIHEESNSNFVVYTEDYNLDSLFR